MHAPRAAMSLLIVGVLLAIVLGASPGFAQASVTIDTPAAHEAVKTPFTVSGRAPAGARLELWIGDDLVQVFRADAGGVFTAAVTWEVAPQAVIYVHQVSPSGERLGTASVAVNWTGTKQARPPDAIEAAPEPQPVPDDIPRTEPVDLGTLQTAPIPPPVTVDGGEDAGSIEIQETAAPPPSRGFSPGRPVRIGAEVLSGFLGGVAGAGIFGMLGLGLGLLLDPGGWTAIGTLIIGGVVGYGVGIGVGVAVVGYALDGNGKVWAVIVGEVVGAAVGLLVLAGGSAVGAYGVGEVALIILPVAGAIAGFELTSDRSRRSANEKALSVAPFIAPSGDGRWVVGPALRLRF